MCSASLSPAKYGENSAEKPSRRERKREGGRKKAVLVGSGKKSEAGDGATWAALLHVSTAPRHRGAIISPANVSQIFSREAHPLESIFASLWDPTNRRLSLIFHWLISTYFAYTRCMRHCNEIF